MTEAAGSTLSSHFGGFEYQGCPIDTIIGADGEAGRDNMIGGPASRAGRAFAAKMLFVNAVT